MFGGSNRGTVRTRLLSPSSTLRLSRRYSSVMRLTVPNCVLSSTNQFNKNTATQCGTKFKLDPARNNYSVESSRRRRRQRRQRRNINFVIRRERERERANERARTRLWGAASSGSLFSFLSRIMDRRRARPRPPSFFPSFVHRDAW